MKHISSTQHVPVHKWRLFSLIAAICVVISACSSSSSSSGAFIDSVETCYNVNLSYTGVNKTQKLCTTIEHGGFNGLGVFRFLRFSLATTSTVSIQVVTISGLSSSDPDLVLFKSGVEIASSLSEQINSESLQVTVPAGDYLVELSEFRYVAASSKSNEMPVSKGLSRSSGETAAVFNLPSAMDVISSPPCDTGNDKVVSGKVSYDRILHNGTSLNYTNITQLPVQQAVISVMCNGQEYSSSVTDQNGDYSLSFPVAQESLVRVRAQHKQTGAPAWDFSIVRNTTAGKPTYTMQSLPFTLSVDTTKNLHADSGWTGQAYTGERVAAPFAILDSVRKAKDKVLFESATMVFPPLNINWSELNTTSRGELIDGHIVTSFFDGTEIFLLGKQDNDTDEYDEHVIIHEWGHYFEENFSRSDSIGGAHTSGDVLDVRVAFGEGFGNAFSAMVLDDPLYIDVTGLAQAEGFYFDIEDNNCLNPGWYSECSIQSIIYDLYDSSDDGVDTISLGFGPIYTVLTTNQKQTPAVTSIFSFIRPLKGISLVNAIDQITGAQNIDPVQDIYGDSQISNNPGATSKLPLHQAY